MSTRIVYEDDLRRVDWNALKADLAADHFDNGRTPEELKRSFANSYSVVIAWTDNRVVGTARLLADGVCNAYLLDVWTASELRRKGIGTKMVRRLLDSVPGTTSACSRRSIQASIDLLGSRRSTWACRWSWAGG